MGFTNATKRNQESPDETFGQHRALAIVDDIEGEDEFNQTSRQVLEYVTAVRQDAERDLPVHFGHVPMAGSHCSDLISLQILRDDCVASITDWELDVVNRFKSLQARLELERIELVATASPFTIPETAAQWRKLIFESYPPPISDMMKFNRGIMFRLVVYLTRWISLSVNDNFSRWAWCILARVELPLETNEACLVHDLGKKTQRLVNTLAESSAVYSAETVIARYTIDLVNVIVGRCFGQLDTIGLYVSSIGDSNNCRIFPENNTQ